MSGTSKSYCRLCAKLKPSDKLTDLQTQHSLCAEIVNKLTRLNCSLDFIDTALPKTVCVLCLNHLQSAFAFVLDIEKAQKFLNELTFTDTIKTENKNYDNDQFESYEEMDHKPFKSDYSGSEEKIKIEINIDDMGTANVKTEESDSEHSVQEPQSENTDTVETYIPWEEYYWKCKYCETQFPTVTELINHSTKYHSVCNAYACTDCNTKKIWLDKFIRHVGRHHGNFRTSCYLCFKRFPSWAALGKHKKIHWTTKYKCKGCNTCFTTKNELDKHTIMFCKFPQNALPAELLSSGLTCAQCEKTFSTKVSLKTHLLTHTKRKRNHVCEICGKSFLFKSDLAGHMMQHEDIKPFQCKICDKYFRTKNSLYDHVGLHDKKKPFSCEVCGKCFRLQKQLSSHSIIHTDNKPYACTFCDKKFYYKTALNLHLRIHTGEKPYSCETCQRQFTNWPNFNKHMKRKHNVDTSKKKEILNITPDASTGEVVDPEINNMLEWKNTLLKQKELRGKNRKTETLEIKNKDQI